MKKFYRSRSNKILGGVAGGLAEYFNIDPLIVRLVIFALLFSGGMIIVYVIAWIFVPLAPDSPATTTQ